MTPPLFGTSIAFVSLARSRASRARRSAVIAAAASLVQLASAREIADYLGHERGCLPGGDVRASRL